jgi:homocysteine S-methyltransferase
MPGYRNALPQLDDRIFLTDSGTETDLIFHHGLELPFFATFPLLDSVDGRSQLSRYYREHLAIATRHASGFILEAPTWRANSDWGPSWATTRPPWTGSMPTRSGS